MMAFQIMLSVYILNLIPHNLLYFIAGKCYYFSEVKISSSYKFNKLKIIESTLNNNPSLLVWFWFEYIQLLDYIIFNYYDLWCAHPSIQFVQVNHKAISFYEVKKNKREILIKYYSVCLPYRIVQEYVLFVTSPQWYSGKRPYENTMCQSCAKLAHMLSIQHRQHWGWQ